MKILKISKIKKNFNQRLLNQSIKEDTQNSKNQKMSYHRLLNQPIKEEDT